MKNILKNLLFSLVLVGVLSAGLVFARDLYFNDRTMKITSDGVVESTTAPTIGFDSFIMTETGTPDMDVNLSAGSVRNTNNVYYHTTVTSSATLTASSAATEKVAILQKGYATTAAPTIKYSAEVGSPTHNMLLANDGTLNEGITVRAAFGWNNGTGSAILLNEFKVGLADFGAAYGDGTMKIYGDSGGLPNMADELFDLGAFRLGYTTRDGNYGASGYELIFTGQEYSIADGVTFYIIWDSTNEGGSNYYPESSYVTPPSGVTSTFKRDVNDAGTWDNWTGGTNSWDFSLSYSTGSLDTPTADANYIVIGTIGSVTTPITASTTAIVEGTPSTNQVKLTPVETNRQR